MKRLLLPVAFFLGSVTIQARAGLNVSGYLGMASTSRATVSLELPASRTVLDFAAVGWDGESFVSPWYFGVRVTFSPERLSDWELGGEFIHAKMYARLDETVSVTGVREGQAVSGRERLGDTFQRLSYSHGHNLLTAVAIRRWSLSPQLSFHAGGGAGVAVPHVEVRVGDEGLDDYRWTGLALEGLGGVSVRLVEHLSLLAEYKLSWANLGTAFGNGGRLGVKPITNHIVFGVTVDF